MNLLFSMEQLRDLWVILESSAPIILTAILSIFNDVVISMLLGRISTVYLASVSLAKIIIMMTCSSLFMGAGTALDTLCSQSFTALKGGNRIQVGIHLQRALLVLAFTLLLPVSLIWFNIERILLLIGQNAEVAYYASKYIHIYFLGLPAYIAADCTKRYLQGQGIFLSTISESDNLVRNLQGWNPSSHGRYPR